MRWLGQDAGHLAADRRRSSPQPGVEPRNVIAFTFTEKAAAELKERILSIFEKEGFDTLGLAEMYVGTMHGYALDLLQRLVPETFKFSVLTDITARLFVDRNSTQVRADGVSDQFQPVRRTCGGTSTPGFTCRRRASCARTTSTGISSLRVWSRRSATT